MCQTLAVVDTALACLSTRTSNPKRQPQAAPSRQADSTRHGLQWSTNTTSPEENITWSQQHWRETSQPSTCFTTPMSLSRHISLFPSARNSWCHTRNKQLLSYLPVFSRCSAAFLTEPPFLS